MENVSVTIDVLFIAKSVMSVATVIGILNGAYQFAKNIHREDPFFIFYFISAVLIVVFLVIVLWKSSSMSQTKSVVLLFTTILIFISIAVIWRYFECRDYLFELRNRVSPSEEIDRPFGLGKSAFVKRHGYVAYFIHLGSLSIIIMSLIFVFTSSEDKVMNRLPIFSAFLGWTLTLLLLRLIWQRIDKETIKKIRVLSIGIPGKTST